MELVLIILIIIFAFCLINSTKIEKFWSRPNKCFDCEKQITSMKDAHLSFPSKCFDCEKQQNIIPYNTGPTKCFDCQNKKDKTCKNNLVDIEIGNYFSNYNRNTQLIGQL